MDCNEFEIICKKIEDIIRPLKFSITNKVIDSNCFGNFLIQFSDEKIFLRLITNTDKCFLEIQTSPNKWTLAREYVNQNFEESTLAYDMQIHKLYETDFSIETNLKFINKLITLSGRFKNQ